MDDKAAAQYPNPGVPPGSGLVGNPENAGLHNDHSFEQQSDRGGAALSLA